MTPAVEFDRIRKVFGGTTALDGVSLAVAEGECHALMGENGAGKSTLGKILAGIHRPDGGTVRVGGVVTRFVSPRDARHAGIGMVHQELAYCPDLSVAENLSLGRYPRRLGVFLDGKRLGQAAREKLQGIAPDIDPLSPMRALSVAQHQLVQIAAAVGSGARILVFDEPTSALSDAETERLFTLIGHLRGSGVTMLYVSHRLTEIFRIADRISVLRDGRYVGTLSRSEATQDTLVRMMIGRPVEEYFPAHHGPETGSEMLLVRGLSSPGRFQDVSFTIHAGEILGCAGLVGSGRSEVARAVFGLDSVAKGTIVLDGVDISRLSHRRRMDLGLALVPEDRKRHGLALALSCRVNFSLTLLKRISRLIFLSGRAERNLLETFFRKLDIKAPSYETVASNLSGGNQQKLVLAKWLARRSRLLILDEPTRGVDVGAKAAIHSLIDELATAGMGILLISSELPEILNLSKRILIMRGGRVVQTLPRARATQELLMRHMAGMETTG